MNRTMAVAVLLGALLLVYRLMYAGWSGRSRRHQLAAEAVRPGAADEPETVVAEGIYVSTTTAGSRLDRVTAAGLGVRSRATMHVCDDGVRWQRDGAATVHVPAARISAVGLESGMAGKFAVGRRIVVVAWRPEGEDQTYATGFLPRFAADRGPVVDAVAALVESRGTATAPAPRTAPAPAATTSDGAP
ncbi:MAG TPA: ABC transporter permease [Dermatophilaceae bacterium]|nr:ABC transporter permease [Dermatophilaceae bacterium]